MVPLLAFILMALFRELACVCMPFLSKLSCVQKLGVVFSSVESDAIEGTVMIEGTGDLDGVVYIFAARRRVRMTS
jgi:hypothetical protein